MNLLFPSILPFFSPFFIVPLLPSHLVSLFPSILSSCCPACFYSFLPYCKGLGTLGSLYLVQTVLPDASFRPGGRPIFSFLAEAPRYLCAVMCSNKKSNPQHDRSSTVLNTRQRL
ncbi:hypothetical protein AMECASPLE_004254 [Ameca splendens]|uniref:Secreted protein n=1 Tax=Ameca splendens TaxID=208324 RepID=A0ABV0ZVG4_9TELE